MAVFPILDQATFDSVRAEVGHAVFASLVAELEGEIRSRRQAAIDAHKARALRQLEVNAHALKSLARSFGLMAFGEAALALEVAARDNADIESALMAFLQAEQIALAVLSAAKRVGGTS